VRIRPALKCGRLPSLVSKLRAELNELKTRLVSHRPEQSTEPPWYVIRMPGGVGGGRPRGPSLSRFDSLEIKDIDIESLKG